MDINNTPDIIESLISNLMDINWNVREEAANTLINIGIPAVGPLISIAEDSKNHLRLSAIEVLGQIGDKRAVETLIAGLVDSNSYIRRESANALKKIGDTRAVESLISILADNDREVRIAAIYALKQIGDGRIIEPLIKTLEDSDWDVRRSAVEALMKFGDTRAVEPLISVLVDPSASVRCSAANALVRFGVMNGDDKLCFHAVEVFITVLDDNDDFGVFENAVRVAPQICAQQIDSILSTNIVKSLINKLNNEVYYFRKLAAESLVAIFRTGWLDESCKDLIAQQHSKITEPHVIIEGTEYDDMYFGGGEYGIGVDFPL